MINILPILPVLNSNKEDDGGGVLRSEGDRGIW